MVKNKEFIQGFADGATSGRLGNLFIEGDTIYSYGHHFPLARRLKNKYALRNSGHYSVTTSTHQGLVGYSLANAGYKVVDLIDCDLRQIPKQIELNNNMIKDFRKDIKNPRVKKKDWRRTQIANLQQQNKWLRALVKKR